MRCAREIAPPADTCLKKINSKDQFNYAQVLGVNMYGSTVPVVHYVATGPGTYKRGVVFFGGTRKHRCFLYEDVQHETCCRLTLRFNMDFMRKRYLTGTLGKNMATTTPYTYTHCRTCNKSLEDSFGNILSYSKRRHWRNGIMVWKACQTVQECASCGRFGYARVKPKRKQTVRYLTSNKIESRGSLKKTWQQSPDDYIAPKDPDEAIEQPDGVVELPVTGGAEGMPPPETAPPTANMTSTQSGGCSTCGGA